LLFLSRSFSRSFSLSFSAFSLKNKSRKESRSGEEEKGRAREEQGKIKGRSREPRES
jgi:hypothetical protein